MPDALIAIEPEEKKQHTTYNYSRWSLKSVDAINSYRYIIFYSKKRTKYVSGLWSFSADPRKRSNTWVVYLLSLEARRSSQHYPHARCFWERIKRSTTFYDKGVVFGISREKTHNVTQVSCDRLLRSGQSRFLLRCIIGKKRRNGTSSGKVYILLAKWRTYCRQYLQFDIGFWTAPQTYADRSYCF